MKANIKPNPIPAERETCWGAPRVAKAATPTPNPEKLPDTLRSVKDSITIGNESFTDLVLKSIYGEKYLYFNKPFKKDLELDEFERISELEQWIRKYWS